MNSDLIVSANELLAMQGNHAALLIDCRFDLSDPSAGYRQWMESRIQGAVYAHLDELLSAPITHDSGRHPLPDMQKLTHWLIAQGWQHQRLTVVYDASGGAFAARLWWLLRCSGVDRVVVLDGGWQNWCTQGLPVEQSSVSGNPKPQSSGTGNQPALQLNADCVVSSEAVVQNLEEFSFQMVDVRSQQRFQGLVEPIDPVAGHIPGAINIPLTDNLDENGCFKSTAELQLLYQPLLPQGKPVAVMCGSGVTACHSIFAMQLAGFDWPKLYAGSWSEWIRDPDRPVARQSNQAEAAQ